MWQPGVMWGPKAGEKLYVLVADQALSSLNDSTTVGFVGRLVKPPVVNGTMIRRTPWMGNIISAD